MVNRFLGWRLPEDFRPDCGISFTPTYQNGTEQGGKFEPVGTNLFTAMQAEEMVRFMLEGYGTEDHRPDRPLNQERE